MSTFLVATAALEFSAAAHIPLFRLLAAIDVVALTANCGDV